MTLILVYTLFTLEPLKDGDRNYPQVAYVIGWCISALGLIQLPIFAIYAFYNQKGVTMMEVRYFFKLNYLKINNFLIRNSKELLNQLIPGVHVNRLSMPSTKSSSAAAKTDFIAYFKTTFYFVVHLI